MGKILDISHHQPPEKINYDKLAKELDFVIIRTQYGSSVVDKHYKTHHAEFKKHGIPRHAYAWVRGASIPDMEREAEDFYNRTKEFDPEVWWLDVEEKSMPDMRAGVSAYVKKLRQLGAKKIGIYVAHHLYKSFNLNLSEVDAVWIPRYGKNDGGPHDKPDYPCDLWQYTSQGKLPGYAGNLDLNKLNGKKPLEWFTGKDKTPTEKSAAKPATKPDVKPAPTKVKTYKVAKATTGYLTATDAMAGKNKKTTVAAGTYFVFNEANGMINVTTKLGVPGSWINPKASKQAASAKAEYHIVKKSDTVSGIAAKYKTTVAAVQKLNPNIKNIHLIYPNQKIRVK